ILLGYTTAFDPLIIESKMLDPATKGILKEGQSTISVSQENQIFDTSIVNELAEASLSNINKENIHNKIMTSENTITNKSKSETLHKSKVTQNHPYSTASRNITKSNSINNNGNNNNKLNKSA